MAEEHQRAEAAVVFLTESAGRRILDIDEKRRRFERPSLARNGIHKYA
jgi:hypothetical protein